MGGAVARRTAESITKDNYVPREEWSPNARWRDDHPTDYST
jgi:hypothetical protein